MSGRARVVVGVAESPAGLGALRVAVAQARTSGRELVAVRAFASPPPDGAVLREIRLASVAPGYVPADLWSKQLTQSIESCRQETRAGIERAFGEAMGCTSDDVSARVEAIHGAPGPVLTAAADRDDDLLVVGASTPRLFRGRRHSVAHYCVTQATCPVLVVPPHELARQLDKRHSAWRWNILEDLLAGETPS